LALDYSIRIQPDGETWEDMGTGRWAGVVPENLNLTANAWGADQATFTMRRPDGMAMPDLTAFTPVDIEIAGDVVWSGRVRETPTTIDGYAVVCEGWQYHLDDDVYYAMYVHNRLPDWADIRSNVDHVVASYPAQGFVRNEVGGVVLGWPTDGVAPLASVGVYIDLGPDPRAWCERCEIEFDGSYGDGNGFMDIMAGTTFLGFDGGTDAGSLTGVPPGWTRRGLTASQRCRYWHLRYRRTAAFDFGSDIYVKIRNAWLMREADWDNPVATLGASAFFANTVIKDALTFAPHLSTDESLILAPAYQLPAYGTRGYKTPREVMEGVNAFHNYDLRLDPERRIVFQPLPAQALFETGSWPGALFTDASMNSSQDVVNKVTVEGSDPLGLPLAVTVERPTSAQTSSNDVPQLLNPSADVSTVNWTGAGFTRTTTAGEFETSPAGFKLTGSSEGRPDNIANANFIIGAKYEVSVWSKLITLGGGGTAYPYYVSLYATDAAGAPGTAQTIKVAEGLVTPVSAGSVTVVRVPWIHKYEHTLAAGRGYYFLRIGHAGSMNTWVFDSVTFSRYVGTLADRRAVTKARILPLSVAMTTTGATQIAQTYLDAHATTPLRGSLSVSSPGGVRHLTSASPVHPHRLLLHTQQLVRLTDRVDPDTGALGRDGRIAAVSYNHDSETAEVSIDNERGNFDALLARLGVLRGG
jgi:hypothetical protein